MESITHDIYKCEYHIDWVPKYQDRIVIGEINKFLAQSRSKSMAEEQKAYLNTS
jgi:REP element-mobilizing transposase RayT